MQDNILVSYSCTHFAILPADVSRENYDWLFIDLHPAAETDLISRHITSHLAIPQACPNPACQTFRLQPWTELIRTAESETHAALIETRKAYMRYGKTYHWQRHPLGRARCLEDPDCALAHKQFTLETRAFHNDPFFMPWRALYAGYLKIKAIINDCRFEISKIEYLLDQLAAGIDVFEGEIQSLRNAMARRKNIVVAHFPATLPPSEETKPERTFAEAKLRADLEIKLDELTFRLKLESNAVVSTSMPLDESTGKTADVAFIEFQKPKQAAEFANLATALGDVRLGKRHRVTFTRLTDVSRLGKLDIDEFRDAHMIPSRSQGAIDEMRRHIRQKSKEQLSNADILVANDGEMSGSPLQEHLAKRKTANLLRHRMDHWGTKLINHSDVHDDTRDMRHAVFRNAVYHTWLKRVEGFAELTPNVSGRQAGDEVQQQQN
ncbi:hypothetical protein AC578_5866 [Pseudocercospora eumusae]|uniref:Uncharacterized protein n=1 Tax=Pseudocercospora eumusae TaxID=321146 RepID=A0A139HD03_9PEZI|nr:hypothetical protein AC578_5866 [Pseudocercospora eumusae]